PGQAAPPPAQAAPPPAQYPPPQAQYPAPPPAQYPPPPPPGQYPPPGQPMQGQPPPPPGYGYPPPQLQQPMVAGPVVRLRSNNPRATLQQMQLRWRDVCVAPCGVPVDPRAMYRIGGRSVKPSAPFAIPRPAGEVYVDAHAGNLVKYWVGVGLSIGGIASAGVGGLYLLSAGSSDTTVSDVAKTYGIVYLITGAILMAIGIPMWTSNGSHADVQ